MKFRKYFWFILLIFSIFSVINNNHVFLFANGEFNVCEQSGVLQALKIVSYVISVTKILIPVLIILKSGISLGKAVLADDDKNIKSSVMSFFKRTIVGALIFFVPTIIQLMINLVTDIDKIPKCVSCVVNSKYCG